MENPIMLPHLCTQLTGLPGPLSPLNQAQSRWSPGAHRPVAPAAQAGAGVWPYKSTRGRVLEALEREAWEGTRRAEVSRSWTDPSVSGKVLAGRPVAEHSKVCPWVQQPTVSDLEGHCGSSQTRWDEGRDRAEGEGPFVSG